MRNDGDFVDVILLYLSFRDPVCLASMYAKQTRCCVPSETIWDTGVFEPTDAVVSQEVVVFNNEHSYIR